ncbi:MAG TPA: S-methyl-5'-thioadenosine phosphorylase [Candidatus Omnitrophota bacterium]|nr:S-methyl-5'-thioadenosine phosphorylase [Candidatus Omnitrophota bacterium]HPD84026.1 S-methyl-5'-thioadenosine phosphorylase [Candidatus Omnitrophota bacterium]HRZ02883.1 S-methyl-5'-thioadenosine phosphorylase [Candidatus Omnitrophota bacterium]
MGKVGVIGGSGLYAMEGLKRFKKVKVETPFGDPSDDYIAGTVDGIDVVFLPRHGKGHRISPSEINYRANIFGMKKLGVDAIVSVSACGSLKEELKPMDFVIPDQFLDRTNRCRQATFFTNGIVAHLAFADPVCPQISEILYQSARKLGISVHKGGTYVNMEGPQFSTKAESHLYRSWGMDIIGMTNLIEAKLAREAEISYATLAAVTDYDCWHEGHETVSIEMIIANLTKNIANAKEILKHAIPQIGRLKSYSAQGALQYAIVTDKKYIPAKVKKDLKIIIGKYIN